MTGFPPAIRQLIIDRQHHACARCCRWLLDGYTQIHHRRARGAGGTRCPESNLPANGLALCLQCHRHIEAERREAYKLGHLIRTYQRPCDVPVWYLGHWVQLHDSGETVPVPDPYDPKEAA